MKRGGAYRTRASSRTHSWVGELRGWWLTRCSDVLLDLERARIEAVLPQNRTEEPSEDSRHRPGNRQAIATAEHDEIVRQHALSAQKAAPRVAERAKVTA